jgi:hypothetical protein
MTTGQEGRGRRKAKSAGYGTTTGDTGTGNEWADWWRKLPKGLTAKRINPTAQLQ